MQKRTSNPFRLLDSGSWILDSAVVTLEVTDMSGSGKKAPVLVVVQLSGGNDFMNTIVPYTNPHYYDNRKTLVIQRCEWLTSAKTTAALWHQRVTATETCC